MDRPARVFRALRARPQGYPADLHQGRRAGAERAAARSLDFAASCGFQSDFLAGHAACRDGVLIKAKDLINGSTIVQAERIETVEYFHIELDRHDVIIAETYRNPRRRRPRHVPQRARIACALSRHGSERSTRSAPMRSRAGHRTTTSRKRRSVSISSSADAAPDRCWQTLARGPRGGRHRPSCLQV